MLLISLPTFLNAQPPKVPNAQWSKVDNFKFCTAGNCEILRKVKLNVKTIQTGQDITVINLETGAAISTFTVKSIRYGRQVKMCWIGDGEGMISDNYITVKDCEL